MSQHPIRVGAVGLGAVGYRVIRAMRQHPAFEVTALCDLDHARLAALASEFEAPIALSDWRDLLAHDFDLAYVGVPPKYHAEMALACLASGKHLLCEKPLGYTLAEAEAMTAAAHASGLVHMVNLGFHFTPGVQVFLDHLRSGYIGDLRRAEINMIFPSWPRAWQQNAWIGLREQGGPVREVCPHLFYLVLRTLGPVVRVRADMEFPADPLQCEQGAFGALELASGQRVTINVLCNLPRPEQVSLTAYGSAGTLGLTNWYEPVGVQGDGPLAPLPVPEAKGPQMLDALAAKIRGEAVALPDFTAGLDIQRVLDAWERAAATGNWVSL